MNLYSIRDVKASYFQTPVCVRSDAEAKRSIAHTISQDTQIKSSIARDSQSFDLYCCGSFNEINGEIISFTPPIFIANVGQIVDEEENLYISRFNKIKNLNEGAEA